MADVPTEARVNVNDVAAIIATELTDEQIQAFITTAHQIVVDRVQGQGLSEDTMTQIEQYLAAHFVSLRDPRVEMEKIGGEYQARYQIGDLGEGLASTVYGQTALALDSTGTLIQSSNRRAGFIVHGTNDP
jgi:hypothetical protein